MIGGPRLPREACSSCTTDHIHLSCLRSESTRVSQASVGQEEMLRETEFLIPRVKQTEKEAHFSFILNASGSCVE